MIAPIMMAPKLVAPIMVAPGPSPVAAKMASAVPAVARGGWTPRRWGAAAALSALVLSIGLVALVLSMNERLPASEPPAEPPAHMTEPPAPIVVVPAEITEPEIATPPAVEPAITVPPVVEARPPRRRLTPAEAAGLEDNPYGP